MKYTKIPTNTFENIQLNAGIIVDTFNPATGEIGNILGASSGGINFNSAPEFKDFGEDIDNCPKNTKELTKLDDRTVTMSGSFATVTVALGKKLVGAADIDTEDATHIVPRVDLVDGDFTDLWWVGDYSSVNSGNNAGFCAIHMKNTLSTGGFQIQTTDKEKGKFQFEFTAHSSIATQDEVPFEIYIKQGTTGDTNGDINEDTTEGTDGEQ